VCVCVQIVKEVQVTVPVVEYREVVKEVPVPFPQIEYRDREVYLAFFLSSVYAISLFVCMCVFVCVHLSPLHSLALSLPRAHALT